MNDAGLSVPDDRAAQVEHAVDAGLDGLARLMHAKRGFDGLVVAGEIWSAAVLLQILKSGKRIPDDIAMVGVGKVELAPTSPFRSPTSICRGAKPDSARLNSPSPSRRAGR